ncbi:zf-CCHC domain-containing protein/RVP_2 domain-containing protein [Gossypium australe]|uniref:Zf-CCHC domain-containing protein/RVP_2 domain-containing protein n=1 Tax=Gossypium australe TaxID=47621 RepID=A0A5B6W964_9ROSI|nr:zf-CCHC domain-containing protein/RVP_2 domain-containing protein [Gossypium australe]
MSACLVCGSMEHRVSDWSGKAILVTAAAPALARGRGHGRGDGGRGASQRGATQGGAGGPARVYAVRQPQTREATDVIASTSTLQSFPLLASVDSGVTRSFILRDVARELGISVETSRSNVTIKSSLGDSVVVDWVYRHCPLMVQGQVFQVDLLELPFCGFDIILGMN